MSLARRRVKVIVHCGDFGYNLKTNFLLRLKVLLERYDMYIVWVDGNHENFDRLYSYDIVDGVRPLNERVIHLPRGYRWQWNGTSYLALGGAHSIDKHFRTPGTEWWHQEWITFADAERAVQGGHADIMICHDAPQGVRIPNLTKTDGWGWPEDMVRASNEHRNIVRAVVDDVKPHFLFHGHYHEAYEAVLHGEDYVTYVIGLDRDGARWTDNVVVYDFDLEGFVDLDEE